VHITVLEKVYINVPPTLLVDFPDDGQVVSGEINVSGTSSDDDGYVVVVEYSIAGGNWRAATGNDTWSFEINTLDYDNGDFSFSIRAYDGTDHTQANRTITIANKWKDVHATFIYPAEGLEEHGDMEVQGNAWHDRASDGRSIQFVEVRVDDGDWKTAHGINPWALKIDTTKYENGEHTLEVRAMDDEGTYSEVDSVTFSVKNSEPLISFTSTDLAIIAAIIIVIIVIIILVAMSSRKGRPQKPKAKRIKDEDEDEEEEEEEDEEVDEEEEEEE
jgi:hypothetical protein